MAKEKEAEKDVDNRDRQEFADSLITQNKCRFCAEKMDPSAIFCNECEKYQDWRRFFSFSQVVLTLLIALISVASTGIPVLLQAVKEDGSDVRASHLSCTNRALRVVISNLGNRAAVLRGGQFILIQNGNDDDGIPYPIEANPKDEPSHSPLLNPGQHRIVEITRKDRALFPIADGSDKRCTYHVTLDVIGFNQPKDPPTVECSCE